MHVNRYFSSGKGVISLFYICVTFIFLFHKQLDTLILFRYHMSRIR